MAAKRRYWGLIPPMPAVALAEVAKQSEAIGLEGIWGIQLYGPPFISLASRVAWPFMAGRSDLLSGASSRSLFSARNRGGRNACAINCSPENR